MSKLTPDNNDLFYILNTQSNTFIGTPEPTDLGELDSMYVLADWLYWASLNTMVSQEIYKFINLS
jgi:hypothetical protein